MAAGLIATGVGLLANGILGLIVHIVSNRAFDPENKDHLAHLIFTIVAAAWGVLGGLPKGKGYAVDSFVPLGIILLTAIVLGSWRLANETDNMWLVGQVAANGISFLIWLYLMKTL